MATRIILRASFALALTAFLAAPALAGNGLPGGKHYNVNMIGVPKAEQSNFLGGKAASSHGHTIFIPLKTYKRPKNSSVGPDGETICTDLTDGAQREFVDEDGATFQTEEPDGRTRIYFDANTDGIFEITDRDAVDGEGRISIPIEPSDDDGDGIVNEVIVDLYVRVLGKPGGCAEISGYAFEDPMDGGLNPVELWWYSGSILVNRKHGKSPWINATDIFETEYCLLALDDDGNPIEPLECEAGSDETLSVFDDIFSEYFWEVNNYNTRLIQMRFYPRAVQ